MLFITFIKYEVIVIQFLSLYLKTKPIVLNSVVSLSSSFNCCFFLTFSGQTVDNPKGQCEGEQKENSEISEKIEIRNRQCQH